MYKVSKTISYSKLPLTPEEKVQKEKEFLSFDKVSHSSIENHSNETKTQKEKEPTKAFLIRAPKSYWLDLQEIVNHTGISMNAICLELLRPAIKRKLKELREE